MQVHVLASGSKGNAYLIGSEYSSRILLDCGIPLKQININSGWKKFDICLISHEHKDHCKAVKDVIRHGAAVYMPKEMKGKMGFGESNVFGLEDRASVVTVDWSIKAFGLHHDVQTLGYVIQNFSTKEKLIYITDTMYCKYKFTNVTHWLIECNYSKDIIDENVASGGLHHKLRNRIVKTHMSLETAKELLLANDLSKTKEIWLLHLSDANSDAVRFKREIQEVTGVPVCLG